MSKFAKFTLIKFVLPTDTSSEEFCMAYYFLHGSLEGNFSVVKSCNTILYVLFWSNYLLLAQSVSENSAGYFWRILQLIMMRMMIGMRIVVSTGWKAWQIIKNFKYSRFCSKCIPKEFDEYCHTRTFHLPIRRISKILGIFRMTAKKTLGTMQDNRRQGRPTIVL